MDRCVNMSDFLRVRGDSVNVWLSLRSIRDDNEDDERERGERGRTEVTRVRTCMVLLKKRQETMYRPQVWRANFVE